MNNFFRFHNISTLTMFYTYKLDFVGIIWDELSFCMENWNAFQDIFKLNSAIASLTILLAYLQRISHVCKSI